MINASEEVQFDVDAMLMYGWVADKEQRVTHLSRSLRRWLERFKRNPELGLLLSTYNSGGHISVAELHRAILHEEREKETADLVQASLGELSDFVERLGLTVLPKVLDFQRGAYTVRRLYRRGSRGEPPLAGMRFLREGGTLMRTGQNEDLVDMVAVAIIRKAGAWSTVGFQGQLQEAWLRARSKLYAGFHSAGVALMARNLSHNIGSHALYWMRQDAERSVAKANGDSDLAIFAESRARFYDYLQARMELLAGFATHMPLSPTTVTIGELLETFGDTRLLLENIARSEAVKSVQIVPDILGDSRIGLPGGEVGAHAFYSILENCIRDSSKYARRSTPNSLTMNVRAQVYKHDERFIEVDVFDDAKNYETADGTDGAGRTLAEKVLALRLVDDGGTLMLHEWGVKERFICAALLRGVRPENFVPYEDDSYEQSNLSSQAQDGPPILQIVNVRGCIAWRFYFNRPGADVLLITDRPADYAQYKGDGRNVEVRTTAQLANNFRAGNFVRSRFVVLDSILTVSDAALAAALPNRLFISKERLRSASILRSCVVDIAADLNAVDLQRLTVEAILARRSEQLPVLTIALGAGEALRAPIPGLLTETVDELSLLSSIPDNRPRAIFQRHDRHVRQLEGVPLTFDGLKQKNVVFYEQRYTNSIAMGALLNELRTGSAFAAYRLLEAAVTRVLVADERLDLAITPEERETLAFRGIEVTGRAFSSGEGPFTGETLRERVTSLIQTAIPKDFAVVHLGIIDKIVKGEGKWTAENLCAEMETKGAKVVVHSGRMDMSSMPRHVKFISLTNVTRWVTNDLAKFQIVDELNALRRI